MIHRVAARLVDREFAAVWLRRPAATIRAKLSPVACDVATRRALYDLGEVEAMHDTTPRRIRAA